jgi:hypothetical protein
MIACFVLQLIMLYLPSKNKERWHTFLVWAEFEPVTTMLKGPDSVCMAAKFWYLNRAELLY